MEGDKEYYRSCGAASRSLREKLTADGVPSVPMEIEINLPARIAEMIGGIADRAEVSRSEIVEWWLIGMYLELLDAASGRGWKDRLFGKKKGWMELLLGLAGKG